MKLQKQQSFLLENVNIFAKKIVKIRAFHLTYFMIYLEDKGANWRKNVRLPKIYGKGAAA